MKRFYLENEKLWIFYGLRDSVLQNEHDLKVAGYMGLDMMKELIKQNFWRLKINEEIAKYVPLCPEC
jgi:hypothetical protein